MRMFQIFNKTVKALLFVIIFVMFGLGITQVFTRYIFKYAIPWCEEIIRYLFIWSTFVGVPVGIYEGRHSAVDFLTKNLSGKQMRIYKCFILFIEAIVSIVFIYYGGIYMFQNFENISVTSRLPMAYVIMAVPVCGILSLIYIAATIIHSGKEE